MAASSSSSPVGRIRGLWQVMRATPDPTTEDGRTVERRRRVILSAGASAMAKLIAMAASLVSVPLTLHYLGVELYGMWMVISSFTAMLAFADLGLGNGILTMIAKEYGRDGRAEMARIISNGYMAMGAVAAILLTGFALAYPFVRWAALFNVSSPQAQHQAGPALAVFVTCFAFSIPGSVVQKVQTGLQQSFVSSLWQALGSVMALIAVLGVILVHGSLPWLVLALVGCPMVAGWINTLSFFGRSAPDLRPAFRTVSVDRILHAAHSGSAFFLLQVMGAVAYGTDTTIIAQVGGAAMVAQYAVPERMFVVISMVVGLALAPLWPAYGEAQARGDRQWILTTLKRSLLISSGTAGALSLVLILFGKQIIHLWVGDSVHVSLMLLLGLGVWRVVEACGNAISFYLNGISNMRIQVIVGLFQTIAKLTFKITLVKMIGPAGIPWGGTIAFLAIGGIPYYVIIRRHLNDLREK